jgi:hypothetical protein
MRPKQKLLLQWNPEKINKKKEERVEILSPSLFNRGKNKLNQLYESSEINLYFLAAESTLSVRLRWTVSTSGDRHQKRYLK